MYRGDVREREEMMEVEDIVEEENVWYRGRRKIEGVQYCERRGGDV